MEKKLIIILILEKLGLQYYSLIDLDDAKNQTA